MQKSKSDLYDRGNPCFSENFVEFVFDEFVLALSDSFTAGRSLSTLRSYLERGPLDVVDGRLRDLPFQHNFTKAEFCLEVIENLDFLP